MTERQKRKILSTLLGATQEAGVETAHILSLETAFFTEIKILDINSVIKIFRTRGFRTRVKIILVRIGQNRNWRIFEIEHVSSVISRDTLLKIALWKILRIHRVTLLKNKILLKWIFRMSLCLFCKQEHSQYELCKDRIDARVLYINNIKLDKLSSENGFIKIYLLY